jgi:hypothetical protein
MQAGMNQWPFNIRRSIVGLKEGARKLCGTLSRSQPEGWPYIFFFGSSPAILLTTKQIQPSVSCEAGFMPQDGATSTALRLERFLSTNLRVKSNEGMRL